MFRCIRIKQKWNISLSEWINSFNKLYSTSHALTKEFFQSELKVDQHAVINVLNHEDLTWNNSFTFKELKYDKKNVHVWSTEVTYHRQFENCARFPMFRIWANILSFFYHIKCFKWSYSKNTHNWILNN